MKQRIITLLATFLVVTALCHAQQNKFNDYVAAIQAQCPKTFDSDWELTSVALDGDTLVVNITVSGQSATYLPYMAANGPQMKQMWLQQLPSYGEVWNRLIARLVAEEKTLVLNLRPVEGDIAACFTFDASDFVPQ